MKQFKYNDTYHKKDGIYINLQKYFYENILFIFTFILGFIIILINTNKYKNHFIIDLITFIALPFWAYFIHIFSHHYKNFIFNWHLFHHNPLISKQPFYMLLEFYGNFIIGGGIIFILYNLLMNHLFNFNFHLNYYIILYWAIIYSTYHVINYHVLYFDSHHNHHIYNAIGNFGPDWVDIIFETKTENEKIENSNSSTINNIIALLIVLLLKNKMENFVKFLNYYIVLFVPKIINN